MSAPLLIWTLAILFAAVSFAALWPRSRANRPIRLVITAMDRLAGRRWLAFATIFVLVIVVRLSVLPLLPVPTPGIHDEFGYLLQADTFCHGRLANPTPAMWESFETFHVNFFPTYSAMYPPAQGAVLAGGRLLGQLWIGVILSNALMCALIYWALRCWMPSRWALLAALLAASKLCVTTYWINSFWGGAPGAIGGALVLGAIGRILRRPKASDAVLLGLGISVLANSRPFEGALYCIPIAAVLFFWLAGRTKSAPALKDRLRRVLLPLSLVLLANFAFTGYYNWRLTGSPYEFPEMKNSREYDVGAIFLWQKPKPPKEYGNEQFEEFYNIWERNLYNRTWNSFEELTRLKAYRFWVTFGWWGLLCAVPGVLYVLQRKRMRLPLACLAFVAAGAFVVTWPYPHYFSPATAAIYACAVMAIRGAFHWRPRNLALGPLLSRAAVLSLVLEMTVAAAAGQADALEWGGARLSARVAILKKLEAIPGKHLLIVRYGREHSIHEEWVYNGADIEGSKVIWARELGEQQDQRLINYYKDRKIWLVEVDEEHASLLPYTRPKK
jgi:hypothetical protein